MNAPVNSPEVIADGVRDPGSPEQPVDRSAWKDRASRALAACSSGGFAVLSGLLLAAVLVILLSSDRSVTTASVLVVYGAAASFLAFRAGQARDARLDGIKVVVAYALTSLLLFLVMNGLYHLFGV